MDWVTQIFLCFSANRNHLAICFKPQMPMLKPPDSLQGNQNRTTEKCRTQRHDLGSVTSTWLSFMRCGQLESEVISVSDLTLMDPTVPHVKEPKTSRNRGISSSEVSTHTWAWMWRMCLSQIKSLEQLEVIHPLWTSIRLLLSMACCCLSLLTI